MDLSWLYYRLMSGMRRRFGTNAKLSYSQCGEDLIVRHIFDTLKIARPSYLDVGAHHPTYLNNTRIFYETGARGVNAEPDPTLITEFHRQRKDDVNLNVGIGTSEGVLPFYMLTPKTLNTFSKEEAEAAVVEGRGRITIDRVIEVPVMDINKLISDHFSRAPDFFSLDVEGMDLSILQSLDYDKHRPKVICVETITYSESRQGRKLTEIMDWLFAKQYFLYADTYINSIFVDREIW